MFDLTNIGKKMLFYGLALSAGLFVNLQLLGKHVTDRKIVDPQQPPKEVLAVTRSDIIDRVRHLQFPIGDHVPKKLLSFTVPEVRLLLKTKQNGTPFAYLAYEELYVLDANGRILGLADSMTVSNLPVITGQNFEVDVDRRRLCGGCVDDVLKLLKLVSKTNSLLYAQISQVNIISDMGVVVYTSWAKGVPIIIGKGKIEEKVTYLDRFYNRFGTHSLIDRTRYLDLRVDGQIILKENT